MEQILNGSSEDEVYQTRHVEGDVIKAQLDDETLRMGAVSAEERFEDTLDENGKEEKDALSSSSPSSSSSDDEEAEVVVVNEKADESELTACSGIDNEVIEEEGISEVVEETDEDTKGSVEEKSGVIITGESRSVEAVAVELANVISSQVEYAEEVIETAAEEMEAESADREGTLQYVKEENSSPAVAKFSNGTDEDQNRAELPETDVNPQIISISERTIQPTSWRGCCGLLEVFKRDR